MLLFFTAAPFTAAPFAAAPFAAAPFTAAPFAAAPFAAAPFAAAPFLIIHRFNIAFAAGSIKRTSSSLNQECIMVHPSSLRLGAKAG